jgi:hypothetical protein
LAALTNAWPDGGYTVTIFSNATALPISLNLSASLTRPGAPHISNYTAVQSVNPTNPFTLSWDAFPGGTTGDYIEVSFGSFTSPDPYTAGALV